jgi:hypothetical protein
MTQRLWRRAQEYAGLALRHVAQQQYIIQSSLSRLHDGERARSRCEIETNVSVDLGLQECADVEKGRTGSLEPCMPVHVRSSASSRCFRSSPQR